LNLLLYEYIYGKNGDEEPSSPPPPMLRYANVEAVLLSAKVTSKYNVLKVFMPADTVSTRSLNDWVEVGFPFTTVKFPDRGAPLMSELDTPVIV
jgi:hypothetical protein